MNKLFIYFTYFSTLLILVSIITLGVWAFYPYKVLEFGPDNGKILQKQVKSGDYLEMQQDYCKYRDIVSHVNRQFINSIIYQVPESLNKRPIGCHRRIEQIYIPKALPPGNYYISTTISFEINPIRKVVLNVKTAQFEIVK